MNDSVIPGNKGECLPDIIVVVRLAKPSMDSLESNRAQASHFSLSSADEATELQSLSVWAREITPLEIARELMGANRAEYRLALSLTVKDIRSICITAEFPKPPLDVVWDPDPRPEAGGHAGIIGLMRPPGGERIKYKALRAKLADIAVVEILPEIKA